MLLAHSVAEENWAQRLAGCLFPGWREAAPYSAPGESACFLLGGSPSTVISQGFHGAGRWEESICSFLLITAWIIATGRNPEA